MRHQVPDLRIIVAVQLVSAAVVSAALFAGPRWSPAPSSPEIAISRQAALRIDPLYDDPTVVSDADLEAVLRKVRPVFPRQQLKPNHVEHALRTWGAKAVFRDPRALSGADMMGFLTNHAEYLKSWNGAVPPLLVPRSDGVAVRWGRDECASVHHDHLLASLTESGVAIDTPVFPPDGRAGTFRDLLRNALRDFRLDEKEVEWSAMAFALWLSPGTTSWRTSDGRTVSFDLIARRLMRGDARFGVCSGTHRVYSLVVLYRVNEVHPILSTPMRRSVRRYLRRMRDAIVAAQFPDGHWASDWSRGSNSHRNPISEPDFKAVIATGHHLEWLAIAPAEFHPPRDVVRQAARWLVDNLRRTPEAEVLTRYTFYSHVGNALALWRKTRPAEFWSTRSAKERVVQWPHLQQVDVDASLPPRSVVSSPRMRMPLTTAGTQTRLRRRDSSASNWVREF